VTKNQSNPCFPGTRLSVQSRGRILKTGRQAIAGQAEALGPPPPNPAQLAAGVWVHFSSPAPSPPFLLGELYERPRPRCFSQAMRIKGRRTQRVGPHPLLLLHRGQWCRPARFGRERGSHDGLTCWSDLNGPDLPHSEIPAFANRPSAIPHDYG